jgi:hypothetical protein
VLLTTTFKLDNASGDEVGAVEADNRKKLVVPLPVIVTVVVFGVDEVSTPDSNNSLFCVYL